MLNSKMTVRMKQILKNSMHGEKNAVILMKAAKIDRIDVLSSKWVHF